MSSTSNRGIARLWIPFLGMGIALVAGWILVGAPLRGLSTHLIGLGGDPLQTYWRFDASAAAVARGSLQVDGDPLRNLSAFPWLPLHWLFGEPAAMNLVWLLQVPLVVGAVWWLGKRLGLSSWLGVLAGFLVAFAPYRLSQSLGHFGAFQVWWIPASWAALLWWREKPSVGRALLGASLLVGTAWTEHTLFLTTLIGIVLFLCIEWRAYITAFRMNRVSSIVGLFVVLVLGIGPFWSEVRETARTDHALQPAQEQRVRFTPTLRTLVEPSPTHALWGTTTPYGTPRASVADRIHTLGILTIGLAAIAVRHRRSDSRPMLLLASIAVVGVCLALLPRFPGGNALVDALPIFSAIRVMDRFLVLVVITLPLLAVYALARYSRPVAFGIATLLFLEILPSPIPWIDLQEVRALADAAAILPGTAALHAGAAADYLVASEALAASTHHHKQVLAHSAFSRVEEPRAELLRVPGVRDLLLLRSADMLRPTLFSQPFSDALRAAVRAVGVGGVVVQHSVLGQRLLGSAGERVTPEDLRSIRTALINAGFTERCQTSEVCAYEAPAEPVSFVAVPEEGFESVGRTADGVLQVRMSSPATIRILVPEQPTPPLVFTFTPRTPRPREMHVVIGERTDHRELRPDQPVRISLGSIPVGDHRVSLSVDAEEVFLDQPSFILERP